MEISIRLWALWIYLFASAYLQVIPAKPAAPQYAATATEEEMDDEAYDYNYDWTLDSSGDPSYVDDDRREQIPCLSYCTCVVESILYCSRQQIVSFGQIGDNQIDTNTRVLRGNVPNSATAVHLGYNNLTFLPVAMFYAGTQSGHNNVADLYVQNNQIKTVHPDAFVLLTKLKNLDLSNNFLTKLIQNCLRTEISSLPHSVVSDLQCEPGTTEANFLQSTPRSLVSLNLNYNLLRGLPNYSFLAVPNLEVLRLSWNRISWISRKAFYGLHKLRILQLRGNPLGANTAAKLGDILQHFVTGELLRPSKDVSLLELGSFQFYPAEGDISSAGTRRSRSKRTTATDQLGPRIPDTVELNSLNELDLGETRINKFPSVVPPSLKRLYLDLNAISSVPAKALKGMEGLEVLQLGGNRITSLKDHNFANMGNLQVLDVSRNNLTRLGPNSFAGLTGLISLRLYGNRQLSQLPRKVFWSLPYLRMLYIHDCNLGNLPPGPWVFRIIALWMYGNPIDCTCANMLSLMTRIFIPMRHPIRIDPYRSVLWDDSDTWEYQRPVKTICASPPQFEGLQFVDVRVRELRCDYQDHFQNGISRQIASSRFISRDYQQDEATTVQSEEDQFVGLKEEFLDDNTPLNKSAIALEMGTEYEKIGKLLSEPDTSVQSEESDIVVPDLQVVEENFGMSKLPAPKESKTAEIEVNSPRRKEDLNQYSDDLLSDFGGQDYVPILKVEADISDETKTEWVISLPAGSKVESKAKKIEKPQQSNANVEEDANTDEGHVRANAKSTTGAGTTHREDKAGTDQNVKTTIGDDSEDDMSERFPQGFAEFSFYDDGSVKQPPGLASQFQADVDSTLSESDRRRLREELDGLSEWKTYNEYYSDEEASGNVVDYEQSYDNFKFVMQVKNMAESGVSLNDLIGNLSEMYNISLFDDPETTKAIPSSDESVFDYGDWK